MELKEQMKKVISYSQGIENPQVDSILKQWRENKKQLMHLFLKDQISYTFPEKVTFELSESNKEQRYNEFLDYIDHLLKYDNCRNAFLNYLEDIKTPEFYNNVLDHDYIISSKDKTIKKGTKIIKSFKYFLNGAILADIQNKASELIQENKVEGYLTFSVHPLDFLSSSENTFHWRSCHSLDGEYRAGNLSYMLDKSTMICFLKSDKDAKLPNFPDDVPWNNKKWRVLLHFDNDYNVVFAGRQYPFTALGSLEVIRQVFLDHLMPLYRTWFGKMMKPDWSHWHNDYISEYQYSEHSEDSGSFMQDYAIIDHGIYGMMNIITDAPQSRHYNDLLRSTCYTKPFYMFKKDSVNSFSLNFTIGSAIPCLKCGNNDISESETMLCEYCENEDMIEEITHCQCECCGVSFPIEDMMWHMSDGSRICNDCFEAQGFRCAHCGRLFFNEDKHFLKEENCFVCPDCYKEEE